jgi:hypothetical protein
MYFASASAVIWLFGLSKRDVHAYRSTGTEMF